MTFGTCQVCDSWVLSVHMETEIRKDSYRRSWAFTSLILVGLVALFGLVYFLVLYAATCGCRLKA